jgi:hypothetical protein
MNAGNAGSSYTWQNNSSLSTFAVTKTGIYSVTADLNGCKKSDTISVIFKNKPLFTLGNDLVLCMGQEHLLKTRHRIPGKKPLAKWKHTITIPGERFRYLQSDSYK